MYVQYVWLDTNLKMPGYQRFIGNKRIKTKIKEYNELYKYIKNTITKHVMEAVVFHLSAC